MLEQISKQNLTIPKWNFLNSNGGGIVRAAVLRGTCHSWSPTPTWRAVRSANRPRQRVCPRGYCVRKVCRYSHSTDEQMPSKEVNLSNGPWSVSRGARIQTSEAWCQSRNDSFYRWIKLTPCKYCGGHQNKRHVILKLKKKKRTRNIHLVFPFKTRVPQMIKSISIYRYIKTVNAKYVYFPTISSTN